MRTLGKQDILDLIDGCAILGTGGGGDPALGVALMEKVWSIWSSPYRYAALTSWRQRI